MDPDSPDHSHPFSNNTRATPARLHILHQSRGAHSRGILDDQHLVECCGLSHISWKYLVGAELAGVRCGKMLTDGQAGPMCQARFCVILQTALGSCHLRICPFYGSLGDETTSSCGPPDGALQRLTYSIVMWPGWLLYRQLCTLSYTL